MKHLFLRLPIVVVCLALTQAVFAQGDTPCAAQALAVSGNDCSNNGTIGNFNTMTTSLTAGNSFACGNAKNNDGWFVIAAADVDPDLIIHMYENNSNSFDWGIMEVYSAASGDCASITSVSAPIDCDTEDGYIFHGTSGSAGVRPTLQSALPKIVQPAVPAGHDLYIRVSQAAAGGSSTDFKICAYVPVPYTTTITADNCADAEEIFLHQRVCGNNWFATDNYAEDPCPHNCAFFGSGSEAACWSTLENTVYYKFVATASSVSFEFSDIECFANAGNIPEGGKTGLQFALLGQANGQSPTMECVQGQWLNNGMTGPPPVLACQSGVTGGTSASITNLASGRTYYIAIDGNAGDDCRWRIKMTSGVEDRCDIMASVVSTPICPPDPATSFNADVTITQPYEAVGDCPDREFTLAGSTYTYDGIETIVSLGPFACGAPPIPQSTYQIRAAQCQ